MKASPRGVAPLAGDVARLGAVVVTRLEGLATMLMEADDSGDDLLHAEPLRQERRGVCEALRSLETASLTPGPAGLPGRWPEPWDDCDDAGTRRPSVIADRIARGEGTADQIRALTAGYRWWTGRMYRLKRDYRRSVVDAVMLEIAENDRGVRHRVAFALVHLGEDACAALCAEVRDIEDRGGLLNVETGKRHTKGGVWFALLRARYAWARFALPRGRRRARPEESGGVAASNGGNHHGAVGAPVSTVRRGARRASPVVPEVIVLRRRRGAL
jgi:PHAX RNA-binding domain